MVSTLLLKNCKKTGSFPFQMFRTFIFYLKVTSKPFPKNLVMTNFEFTWSGRLSLALSENGFNLVTQNLQKSEKYPFQTLRTFSFESKVASKPCSKTLPLTKF